MPRQSKSPSLANIPAPRAIDNKPELLLLLGDAPYVYQRFGLDHAVEYLRQRVRQSAVHLPPLAERVALLGRVADKTDPQCALELAEKALSITDSCVEALLLSGSLYDRLGRKAESKAVMLRVAESDLATPDQTLRAASMLVRQGVHDIALKTAITAFDALGRPLLAIPALLHIAQRTADWALLNELTARLRTAYASGHMHEVFEDPRDHLLWCADEATNLQVTRQWAKRVLTSPANLAVPPAPEPLKGRRLRAGYLSSDFREHPGARLINGLFRHHDKNKFELFMYCSGWDDDSAIRKQICSHFEHIHLVSELGDQEAADLMRSHKLDILVERNGPTRANRVGILAHRPAPVIIHYLAFPGSVGGIVDYIIGDDYTVPEGAEALYPEKIIRVPHTYQINDYAARPPLKKRTRTELDMPEGDVLILGMFNNIDKVHGEVWDAWMRILEAVPNAMLWTLNHGEVALKNMALAALARGIDPNRIVIGPGMKQDEHLERMQACDLMLDPWPYGGHTTTSDALFAGVPVITLAGSNFAGRVSAGLLRAAGLESLVMPDIETYVQTTISLLRNPQELTRIKQYLDRTVMDSPVFDTAGRTRHIEAAYVIAVERAEKLLPPEHIRIQDSTEIKPLAMYQSATHPQSDKANLHVDEPLEEMGESERRHSEVNALKKYLPYDKEGDNLFSLMSFIRIHNRLPTDALIFNDVLYKIKTTDEISNPLRVFVTDKEFLKIYVKAILGDQFNVPTIKIIRNEQDLLAYQFPSDCVIKPTHASGAVIIRRDNAPVDRLIIMSWLKSNYYEASREANYKTLVPKVIVEPILFNNENIEDYKIFCYKGMPKLIQIDFDRYTNHKRKFFDADWNELDITLHYLQNPSSAQKPATLHAMWDAAKKLSANFSFVRVDIYTDNKNIYIGEITNCHGSAGEKFGSFEEEKFASKIIFED